MQVDRSNGNVMALSAVHLNSDVYLVCLTHALSTEKEEIMGLLIGDVSLNFSHAIQRYIYLQGTSLTFFPYLFQHIRTRFLTLSESVYNATEIKLTM